MPGHKAPLVRIAIVGAGAAGVFAALRAKELKPEAEVTVFESAAQPLGKVRISGGGRCNVTHDCADLGRLLSHYPRGGKALRGVLQRFDCRATRRWFESRGVALKTEADGRMFPVTDSSQTIIDCLLGEACRLGVHIRCRQPVSGVEPSFRVRGETFEAVLLACGSVPSGYRSAVALGHTLVDPVPSLFTFVVRGFEDLQGLSLPAVTATLEESGLSQSGPLLFTHWGLSGPAVLRLSAWGARELAGCGYRAGLRLDLLPALGQEEVRQALLACKSSRRQMSSHNPFGFPRRFWERWALDRPWCEVSDKSLNRMAEELKRWRLRVEGKGVFKEEFVTAGGVPLAEVDLETMQSRRCPGLFLAGEILDIDGVTGGFNFQSAWATGFIAGSGMVSFSNF